MKRTPITRKAPLRRAPIKRRPPRRILRADPEERAIAADHETAVRDLGCIICRRLGRGFVSASIHHCRFPVGMGQRSSHLYAIPLAPAIHQLGLMAPEWPWPDDVPIHAGDRPFRARYGVGERELLAEVWALVGALPIGCGSIY